MLALYGRAKRAARKKEIPPLEALDEKSRFSSNRLHDNGRIMS